MVVLKLQCFCVVLVLRVWCYDRSDVVVVLKLQCFCVVLVLLVLCYDRSATHVSVLAMSCFG